MRLYRAHGLCTAMPARVQRIVFRHAYLLYPYRGFVGRVLRRHSRKAPASPLLTKG
jgi:hypothetical protein